MKKIRVEASKSYDIIIGKDLLKNCGKYIKELKTSNKILIVTDDIVDSLYSKIAESSLNENGFKTHKFVIKNGEQSKNAENYIALLEFMAKNYLTRSDCVVALGGGVVGDLAGFAAATYLRGIPLVQIPTTLLAAVDSSVGGKTAIDLENGKNLAGAFYQPSLVLCDYLTLNTLPKEVFSDGISEVIKYGALGSVELYEHLEKNLFDLDIEYVIGKCVEMKKDIVCSDEFDKGIRQLLNFGHTIAHTIEALSHYEITHGRAVAIGMAIVANASLKNNLCDEECANSLISLIKKFNLPTETNFSIHDMCKIILNDKKRQGDTVTLVTLKKKGECVLLKKSIPDIERFFS